LIILSSWAWHKGTANSSSACLNCYYTCHTCSGPNDYECLSCFGDAELDDSSSIGKYCHNKHLISKVVGSSNWSYLLTLGFILNASLVICLIIYIIRRRRARAGKQSLLDRVKSPANKFRQVAKGFPGKIASQLNSFNDYDDSSSEVEDFVKPYSDEPDNEKFLKPYGDDE